MSMTQSEILEALGLAGYSPTRAVVAYSAMDMDESKASMWFREITDAEMPPLRIINAVLGYIIQDAAAGKPQDIAGCIAKANTLAERIPSMFSDAAAEERAAERAKARAEKEAKRAKLAERAAEERTTVAEDGTVTHKRGRPRKGEVTVYSQVKELYNAATDRSKEAMLPLLQEKLGLTAGTAQTYWYKAKKETGLG